MARMNTTARAAATDLVQEFLESQAVARMLGYAEMAGPNPVSRAADDLRRGRAAVVDSALLPTEVAGDFFDRHRHLSLRLRLQRGQRPEVVIPERSEEPTVDTVPMEVTRDG